MNMAIVQESGIPFMMLRDDKYYLVLKPDGSAYDFVRFRAKVGQIDFFKVAVAEWTWPDGKQITVTVQPFTQKLLFSEPLPFGIRYSNAVWYAPLVMYGV